MATRRQQGGGGRGTYRSTWCFKREVVEDRGEGGGDELQLDGVSLASIQKNG